MLLLISNFYKIGVVSCKFRLIMNDHHHHFVQLVK
jgi:hypothetical protein